VIKTNWDDIKATVVEKLAVFKNKMCIVFLNERAEMWHLNGLVSMEMIILDF
jgi:hypothetical protein